MSLGEIKKPQNLSQSETTESWQKTLIEPLKLLLTTEKEALMKKVQTTKVDFFTLVRGED